MPSQPLVSIGIPTFNRPDGLADTLRCMVRQTYPNLEIIVSDNYSDIDPLAGLPGELVNDPRMRFFRQDQNIGPMGNFEFVFRQATGDYFMWASDDDLWEPEFVSSAVNFLESNPEFDAWFATIDNIDSDGALIRTYDSFERFSSGPGKWRDVWAYLVEPEIMGKANLVYSLYRIDCIRDLVESHMMRSHWGSDMCFNLALISRFRLKCDSRVLLHKRLPDGYTYGNLLKGTTLRESTRYIFPLSQTWPYFLGNLRAAGGLVAKIMVIVSTCLRLPLAVRNWHGGIAR